eukprot:scaffold6708_cov134-Cylindrotheca_fusiformis.AAC.27
MSQGLCTTTIATAKSSHPSALPSYTSRIPSVTSRSPPREWSTTQSPSRSHVSSSSQNAEETKERQAEDLQERKLIPSDATDVAFYLQETASDDGGSIDLVEDEEEGRDDKGEEQNLNSTPASPRSHGETKSQDTTTDVSFYLEDEFEDDTPTINIQESEDSSNDYPGANVITPTGGSIASKADKKILDSLSPTSTSQQCLMYADDQDFSHSSMTQDDENEDTPNTVLPEVEPKHSTATTLEQPEKASNIDSSPTAENERTSRTEIPKADKEHPTASTLKQPEKPSNIVLSPTNHNDSQNEDEQVKSPPSTLSQVAQSASADGQEGRESQPKIDIAFYLENMNDYAAAEREHRRRNTEDGDAETVASSSSRIDMDGSIRHKVVVHTEGESQVLPSKDEQESEIAYPPSPERTTLQGPHPASKIRIVKRNAPATPGDLSPAESKPDLPAIPDFVESEEPSSPSVQGTPQYLGTSSARGSEALQRTDAIVTPSTSSNTSVSSSVVDIKEPVGCGCGFFRSRRRL